MDRLYLLGVTRDLKGLVVSREEGSREAAFWIPVDETLVRAIEKLQAARGEPLPVVSAPPDRSDPEPYRPSALERAIRDADSGLHDTGDVPLDEADDLPAPGSEDLSIDDAPEDEVDLDAEDEVEAEPLPPIGRSARTSKLSPKDIQQLLREGRSVRSVAKASGASRAWIERLLEPVIAEREGVVRLAQQATLTRPRLGRSGLAMGRAVRKNLEDRRATIETLEALDDAWDARATHGGGWRVWVRFEHRGRRMIAEWDFDKSARELTPRNRLASELGWASETDEEDPGLLSMADEGDDPEPKPPKRKKRSPSRSTSRSKVTARKPTRKAAPRKPSKRASGSSSRSSRAKKKPASRAKRRR